MEMFRVIDHKDHTVDVRADLAESVCCCVHCRGTGRESSMRYHNPWAFGSGGIIALWDVWRCCICGGFGTLKVATIQ